MFLRDLADVKNLFSSLRGSFLGVGMTAYSRIVPADFLQPYPIIALRKTRDLPLLQLVLDVCQSLVHAKEEYHKLTKYADSERSNYQ